MSPHLELSFHRLKPDGSPNKFFEMLSANPQKSHAIEVYKDDADADDVNRLCRFYIIVLGGREYNTAEKHLGPLWGFTDSEVLEWVLLGLPVPHPLPEGWDAPLRADDDLATAHVHIEE